MIIVPALFLAGLVVLVLGLPVWLPWVLQPIAAKRGATFSRYEREGYGRFVVWDVTYTNRGTTFTARRLEAFTPTTWLWRLAFVKRPLREVFASAEDCTLRVEPAGTTNTPGSVSAESRKANHTLHQLATLMPLASVSNATLRIPRQTAAFSYLIWSNSTFFGHVQLPQVSDPIRLEAHRSGPSSYTVNLSSTALSLESTVHASTNANGLALQSTTFWLSNRFDLEAQFGPEGNLPETAAVKANQLVLPAQMLRIPHYQDLRGSVLARWQQGGYLVDIHGEAESPPGASNVPPFKLDLHARGDTNAATVETATLTSPALKAELSRDLTVHFYGKVLREPAFLSVDADLSRQKWLNITGRLKGEADLSPGTGKYPEARFNLAASELGYDWLEGRAFTVRGRLDWPVLEVHSASAQLTDGSHGVVSGNVDLEKRLVTDGRFFASGPVLRRWLPDGYGYDALSITGKVSGALETLAHSGQLSVSNLFTPQLKPQNLQANWEGAWTKLSDFHLALSSPSSLLAAGGGVQVSSNRVDLSLNQLSLETNGYPCIALRAPAELTGERQAGTKRWFLRTSPFELAGAGGRVKIHGSAEWPDAADVHLEADRVSSKLISTLASSRLPDVEVVSLAATAAWTNTPARFSIAVSGSSTPPEKFRNSPRIGLKLDVRGDATGLIISNLVLSSQTSTVAIVEGALPVSFSPWLGTNFLRIQTNAPIRLSAHTDPRSAVWDELARYSGVTLQQPRLETDLSGTWAAPQGSLKAGAAKLRLPKRGFLPGLNLESLDIQMELDRGEARLTTGRLLVQGQPVSFAAELPLGDGFWAEALHGKMPDLSRASGRVLMEDAELSAFEPVIPNVLAPQGDITVDLSLYPGRDLRGQISVAHARTRPLGAAGPIRGIFVNLTLKDQLIRLERASATIGASTVAVTGEVDLTGAQWLDGELPPFNLSVHGLGVPLARQPEFVLRSDLLLGITKTNGAPPLITGAATLHDSYFLSDLRDLVPGKVASPERRPPYFSIQEPFLSDWRLAVDVSGPGFLKLRSPLFNGLISANIKLQGTLKDPIALGDLKTDSGAVRFPFASLQVQQGLVSLTSQDPYHPQLSVNAGSKQFGYEIRMNVTGPVDAPIIQFTSNPPLSSEQILLMISAGELPQGTFSLTPQQRAQTVALFLGRDLLSKIGVGDEAQQRLSIRSGEQISEQGRPTYQVEYKVSDRWSITGEYDRFGDFNAGVKWRVYSR